MPACHVPAPGTIVTMQSLGDSPCSGLTPGFPPNLLEQEHPGPTACGAGHVPPCWEGPVRAWHRNLYSPPTASGLQEQPWDMFWLAPGLV